eukprot:scaffold565_cov358-Prasinococcus_capsulatus_cf.AAC.11
MVLLVHCAGILCTLRALRDAVLVQLRKALYLCGMGARTRATWPRRQSSILFLVLPISGRRRALLILERLTGSLGPQVVEGGVHRQLYGVVQHKGQDRDDHQPRCRRRPTVDHWVLASGCKVLGLVHPLMDYQHRQIDGRQHLEDGCMGPRPHHVRHRLLRHHLGLRGQIHLRPACATGPLALRASGA